MNELAEIWFDPATNEVKAVYSGRYSGTRWADAGYEVYRDDAPLPRGMSPRAVIRFEEGKPVVDTPAPDPDPDPKVVRIGELVAKLMSEDLSVAELNELERLERGR